MTRARSFFYVCLGILALALAYHFGATTATAQAPGNPVTAMAFGGNTGYVTAMTADGDLYFTPNYGTTWYRYPNCFTGSVPTPAQSISIGQLKTKYAK
jgi:hypothetical protein